MVNSAASRLVLAPFSEQLITDASHETLREAGGNVSCAFVFASADYQPHLEDFLELVQLHGHVPLIVGCSSSGVLASGGQSAEDVFIFHDHKRVETGALALAMKGGVRITPVVSQGCTPIGEPLLITGADNNVMLTLGSKPAYEALSEAFGTLPDAV